MTASLSQLLRSLASAGGETAEVEAAMAQALGVSPPGRATDVLESSARADPGTAARLMSVCGAPGGPKEITELVGALIASDCSGALKDRSGRLITAARTGWLLRPLTDALLRAGHRGLVARVLAQPGKETPWWPAMLRWLGGRDPDLALDAALAVIRSATNESMIDAAASIIDDPTVRWRATREPALIDASIRRVVRSAQRSSVTGARRWAALRLWNQAKPSARDSLSQLLCDPVPEIRAALMADLSMLDATTRRLVVETGLSDPHPQVVGVALEAAAGDVATFRQGLVALLAYPEEPIRDRVRRLLMPHADIEVARMLAVTSLSEPTDVDWRALGYPRKRPGITRESIGDLLAEYRRSREQIDGLIGWGLDEAWRLLGRDIRITSCFHGLGRTRIDEDGVPCIEVDFRPAVEGAHDGLDLVRGLILHETGHHLGNDFSAENRRITADLEDEGLRALHNLLLDAARDRGVQRACPGAGVYLSRLCAYAFIHLEQVVPLRHLIEATGRGSEDLLRALGRTPGHLTGPDQTLVPSLRLQRGELVRVPDLLPPVEVFAACLRVGMPPPAGSDPRVAAALSLIPSDLADRTHADLAALTRRVAAALGFDAAARRRHRRFARLLRSLLATAALADLGQAAEDEASAPCPRARAHLLRLRRARFLAGAGSGYNPGQETSFEPLEDAAPPDPEPGTYEHLVAEVAPHIPWLRNQFQILVRPSERLRGGFAAGSRVDVPAVRRASRAPQPTHRLFRRSVLDLRERVFVGVLLDKSGSMSVGRRLRMGKSFVVLVAEAVGKNPRVTGRVAVFDDQHYIDLGELGGPGIRSIGAIESGEGNNDAAALDRMGDAALTARVSRRVIVMISDDSPTECAAGALGKVISDLTAQGVLLAHVNVADAAARSFPNAVVIGEGKTIHDAVGEFGRLLVRLSRGSVGRRDAPARPQSLPG